MAQLFASPQDAATQIRYSQNREAFQDFADVMRGIGYDTDAAAALAAMIKRVNQRCECCGVRSIAGKSPDMAECPWCRSVMYCSPECWVADFLGHRPACVAAGGRPPVPPASETSGKASRSKGSQ